MHPIHQRHWRRTCPATSTVPSARSGRRRALRAVPPVLVALALMLGGCTYSSNDRAQELAAATPTSRPTPAPTAVDAVPEPTPEADDLDGADPDDDGDDPRAPPRPAEWVTIRGVEEALNVRAGPGTEHAVVGQAELGLTLATTGQVEGAGDSAWIEVVFEDEPAWVFASYLEPASVVPTPTPLATPTPLPTPTPRAAVDALIVDAPAGLNLRARPGGRVLQQIDDGEVVTPTGRTRTVEGRAWVEIEYGDDMGWVAEEFVRPA